MVVIGFITDILSTSTITELSSVECQDPAFDSSQALLKNLQYKKKLSFLQFPIAYNQLSLSDLKLAPKTVMNGNGGGGVVGTNA